ncbi:MAG: dipeptide/oligopeptide/nickel ABC transporter permease/ATP-binding protein [Sciscionella sp.]
MTTGIAQEGQFIAPKIRRGPLAGLARIAAPVRAARGLPKWLLWTGIGLVTLFVVLAIFAPLISPYGFAEYQSASGQPFAKLLPPSSTHWFGTNVYQTDVFARVVYGARTAIEVVILAVIFSLCVGVPLGLISGWRGGAVDRVLVLIMDALFAFPYLLLAIVISFLLSGSPLGGGVVTAAVAITVVYIPQYFRVVRGSVLQVREESYVEAARALGATGPVIVMRYVFANVIQTVPVIATINAADAILTLAGLGFLGYGIQPTVAAEWGYDVQRAISDVGAGIWWTAVFPGLAIVLLVTGLTLTGEGLNDVINPVLRRRHFTKVVLPTPKPRPAATPKDTAGPEPVISVHDLRVYYGTERGAVRAVDGVSFDIRPGEVLGLVGESGCGKSTLGRGVLGLLPPGAKAGGEVTFDGGNLLDRSAREMRDLRGPELGLIFQEPMTRLNPLMRVSDHFFEALRTHERRTMSKAQMRRRSLETLAAMGIPPTRFAEYPHEFSGGMRQRIMIALALVLEPKFIVADEPTTALDVLVEAQILGILADLKRNFDTSLLLITHNLGIVAEACDRVAVMYAGKIAEIGDAREVFSEPAHPYTRELLGSTISLSTTALRYIPGAPPDLGNPPPACRFHPRCPDAMQICQTREPVDITANGGQTVACWLHGPGDDITEAERSPLEKEEIGVADEA